jgi:alpha-glucosidase
LNFRNPKIDEEFHKILTFWLDKGVDGFRIDAINHMFEVEDFADESLITPGTDPTFYDNLYHNHTMNLDETYDIVAGWRKLLDDYALTKGTDKKFIMTEAYATVENQKRWYGTSDKPISHMPFNFQLISQLNRNSNAQDFKNAVDSWYSDLPSFAEANWVLGNHDRARIGYRYGDERHESLAMFTMLLPGINVVYYVS